jgi:enterochelin esterase family protein
MRQLLARREELDDAAVREFIATHGSPITEGTSVTFLFYGRAESVKLRHFIYALQTTQDFQRLGETQLWYLTIEVPTGSRIEYKLEVVIHGRSRLVRDPLNARLAHDPYGANSVLVTSGYEPPLWIHPDPEARHGTTETITVHSKALGGDREVEVYLPARMRRTRRYPLLVCFDGRDYLHFASLRTVLDNLIHRYEIAPLVVACTQSPDRMRDYAASEEHSRFVGEELVPELERRYPLREGWENRGLMGASLGAVASLHAAVRHPGRFGRLMLQSGSFAFTDIGRQVKHPVLEPVMEFVNRFRGEPASVSERVFLSCGVYEGLIYENRSFYPLLQGTGMEVRFVESRDGHNWENWRDRLRQGLAWLFPGPLGLVYE